MANATEDSKRFKGPLFVECNSPGCGQPVDLFVTKRSDDAKHYCEPHWDARKQAFKKAVIDKPVIACMVMSRAQFEEIWPHIPVGVKTWTPNLTLLTNQTYDQSYWERVGTMMGYSFWRAFGGHFGFELETPTRILNPLDTPQRGC